MVATGVLAAAVHRRKLLKAQRGASSCDVLAEAMVGTDPGSRLVVLISIGSACGKYSHHGVCVDDSRAARGRLVVLWGRRCRLLHSGAARGTRAACMNRSAPLL